MKNLCHLSFFIGDEKISSPIIFLLVTKHFPHSKFYFDYSIGKPLRMILMNITRLLFGIWCSFRYIAVFDRLIAWYLSKDIVFSNLLWH